MFILRRINGQGIQMNFCLGKDFTLVRQEDGKEFEETMKVEAYFQMVKEDIYGFIVYNDGKDVFPLYKGQENYIMLSDGKTFSNLTFKK